MTLSASSMASKVKAAIDAVSAVQVVGSGSIDAYRTALILAMCTGIVEEITQNAVVHTIDSMGDTCNNGTIT
jgi:hypothetical protein